MDRLCFTIPENCNASGRMARSDRRVTIFQPLFDNNGDMNRDTHVAARPFAILFGVAVAFPLLVYYGVSTFSPAPKWGDSRLFSTAS